VGQAWRAFGRSPAESLNWFIFWRGMRTTECRDPADGRPGSIHAAERRRPGPATKRRRHPMSTPHSHDDENAPVPWVQQLLDNPFLLLFLGVFVPMMVYTVWGVVDILTLPMAK
jgi:hypothetical protein